MSTRAQIKPNRAALSPEIAAQVSDGLLRLEKIRHRLCEDDLGLFEDQSEQVQLVLDLVAEDIRLAIPATNLLLDFILRKAPGGRTIHGGFEVEFWHRDVVPFRLVAVDLLAPSSPPKPDITHIAAQRLRDWLDTVPICPDITRAFHAVANRSSAWRQAEHDFADPLAQSALNLGASAGHALHHPGQDVEAAPDSSMVKRSDSAIFSPSDTLILQPTDNALSDWALNLNRMDLKGSILSGARIKGARFWGTDLSEARLDASCLEWCDFTATRMEALKATNLQAEGSLFWATDLRSAQLSRSALLFATFAHMAFVETNMRGSDLSETVFRNTRFEGASFSETRFHGADFAGVRADRSTSFENAEFDGAVFWHCDFSAASNCPADLELCFGDGTVRLPEGHARPDHWPDQELTYAEFENASERWQRQTGQW